MRIGILTHPQGANYGGLLQCYALCTYLKKIGHEPIVIRREPNKSFFLWECIREILKRCHYHRYYTPHTVDRIKNIRPFIENNLKRTNPVYSRNQMFKLCKLYHLNAVIVGSDQVWRKDFAMRFGFNYFLDFVPNDVKKLSYAASFGLSKWLYDETQNKRIAYLLKDYVGISVREYDAICLLKENLNIEAKQHVDPTFLLSAEDYSLVTSPRLISEDYIFVYWLGSKDSVKERIEELESKGKKVISLFLRDNVEQISVEDWLSYIMYADSIITDSFHGCVFSIIFQKQFQVLKNDSGGNGRISSLCNMLGILPECYKDYTIINSKLKCNIQDSFNYLQNILNN